MAKFKDGAVALFDKIAQSANDTSKEVFSVKLPTKYHKAFNIIKDYTRKDKAEILAEFLDAYGFVEAADELSKKMTKAQRAYRKGLSYEQGKQQTFGAFDTASYFQSTD